VAASSSVRFPRRILIGVVCILSAASGLAPAFAPARAQSPAPASYRGGPAHPGAYSGGGTTIAGLQWRFLTGGDVVSSPAIDAGVVYVGSGDGMLYAIDLERGTKRWSYAAGAPIAASPSVAHGLVYAGSYDGRFFAVDARSGAQRWTVRTGPVVPFPWGHESGDRYTSSPTIADGLAVFGAGDGFVYAVDALTGRQRWRAKTDGRVRGSPAVVNGTAFVGSFDGRVYAFDLRTGKERWRYDTEGASLNSGDYGFDRRSIQSSPAVANGTVFIGARDGFVYAIDAADGKLRWRYDHKVSWINAIPAVVDGVVYDGTSDGHFVQALDATSGKELWRFATNTTVWSSAAVTKAQVFVGDGAGRLLVLNRATGALLASFRTAAGIFGSPVVTDRFVVFGSNDGAVYALRLSDDPPVQRAVFLDSAYVRADAAGRSVEIATYLSRRGYTVLDPSSIADYLQARIADQKPSVVVFATEHLPASLASATPKTSPLRRYLDAGGKVVWSGVPPLVWSLDSAGHFPGLDKFKWNAPTELLDVDHSAGIFDDRGVRSTDEWLRHGLPRLWRSAWGVNPAAVTRVLALDDWGLAAGWLKSYGGAPGTGFVRVPDDPLTIYVAAEYRPAP
jgi:outer membrane protein assembly factor BamB